jgi:phosphoribosylaminoimidazole (AIR) synthetase
MVIVPATDVDKTLESLAASGETAMLLGEIVAGSGQVKTGK